LILPTSMKQSVILREGNLDFPNLGSASQFEIMNYIIYTSDNGTCIIVDFKLKGIISYHMTNTFMPTITLLIITGVTLLFDQSKMEVAVGLSLTVMLVMYTMYQSITNAVTKTAYLKMLDYWLLFCLLMPFVIFMIQIYWFLKKHNKVINIFSIELTTKNNFAIKKLRTMIQIATFVLSFLFLAVYFCVAMLMFNEIF